jgi:hypothetical protein
METRFIASVRICVENAIKGWKISVYLQVQYQIEWTRPCLKTW